MKLIVDVYDKNHQDCGDAVIFADKGELMITAESPADGLDTTMLLSDFHQQGYYMERPRIA